MANGLPITHSASEGVRRTTYFTPAGQCWHVTVMGLPCSLRKRKPVRVAPWRTRAAARSMCLLLNRTGPRWAKVKVSAESERTTFKREKSVLFCGPRVQPGGSGTYPRTMLAEGLALACQTYVCCPLLGGGGNISELRSG